MNKRRKAKKAYQLGEYYYYKNSNDKKGIEQYEKSISFATERYVYSENLYYNLAKLSYYSGYYIKAENYIEKCLEYSNGYIEAYKLQSQIYRILGKDMKAEKSLGIFNKKMKELDAIRGDLE